MIRGNAVDEELYEALGVQFLFVFGQSIVAATVSSAADDTVTFPIDVFLPLQEASFAASRCVRCGGGERACARRPRPSR